ELVSGGGDHSYRLDDLAHAVPISVSACHAARAPGGCNAPARVRVREIEPALLEKLFIRSEEFRFHTFLEEPKMFLAPFRQHERTARGILDASGCLLIAIHLAQKREI